MAYYIQTDKLVDSLASVLKVLGYAKDVIELKGEENYRIRQEAPDGSRGFTCVVNLSTGNFKVGYGSRDEENYFYDNSVDTDYGMKSLEVDQAVIKGITNEQNTIAHVVLHKKLFDTLPGNKKKAEENAKKDPRQVQND